MTTVPLITLIEASPTQSLMLTLKLEERGFAVAAAGTLDAGLAAGGARPDLLILDLRTTGETAEPALRRIRGRFPGLPVLLVGAAGAPEALPARLGEGVHVARDGSADAVVEAAARLAAAEPDGAGEDAGAPTPTEEDVFRRSRILVVDDSVTYREFLRMELEDAGCEVVAAGGPEEAMAALAEEPFDCIVIDLIMPGVTGAELCERFDRFRRSRRRLFDVVVHTSQEHPEQLVACLHAGADAFIGKSHSMEVFKARLFAMLRRTFFVEDAFLGGKAG